jgi:hypothetical protein
LKPQAVDEMSPKAITMANTSKDKLLLPGFQKTVPFAPVCVILHH